MCELGDEGADDRDPENRRPSTQRERPGGARNLQLAEAVGEQEAAYRDEQERRGPDLRAGDRVSLERLQHGQQDHKHAGERRPRSFSYAARRGCGNPSQQQRNGERPEGRRKRERRTGGHGRPDCGGSGDAQDRGPCGRESPHPTGKGADRHGSNHRQDRPIDGGVRQGNAKYEDVSQPRRLQQHPVYQVADRRAERHGQECYRDRDCCPNACEDPDPPERSVFPVCRTLR
jgi:hypothetical protein